MRATEPRNSGFTLTEVIVAAFVGAILIGGSMVLFVFPQWQAYRTQVEMRRLATQRDTATSLLSEDISQVVRIGYNNGDKRKDDPSKQKLSGMAAACVQWPSGSLPCPNGLYLVRYENQEQYIEISEKHVNLMKTEPRTYVQLESAMTGLAGFSFSVGKLDPYKLDDVENGYRHYVLAETGAYNELHWVPTVVNWYGTARVNFSFSNPPETAGLSPRISENMGAAAVRVYRVSEVVYALRQRSPGNNELVRLERGRDTFSVTPSDLVTPISIVPSSAMAGTVVSDDIDKLGFGFFPCGGYSTHEQYLAAHPELGPSDVIAGCQSYTNGGVEYRFADCVAVGIVMRPPNVSNWRLFRGTQRQLPLTTAYSTLCPERYGAKFERSGVWVLTGGPTNVCYDVNGLPNCEAVSRGECGALSTLPDPVQQSCACWRLKHGILSQTVADQALCCKGTSGTGDPCNSECAEALEASGANICDNTMDPCCHLCTKMSSKCKYCSDTSRFSNDDRCRLCPFPYKSPACCLLPPLGCHQDCNSKCLDPSAGGCSDPGVRCAQCKDQSICCASDSPDRCDPTKCKSFCDPNVCDDPNSQYYCALGSMALGCTSNWQDNCTSRRATCYPWWVQHGGPWHSSRWGAEYYCRECHIVDSSFPSTNPEKLACCNIIYGTRCKNPDSKVDVCDETASNYCSSGSSCAKCDPACFTDGSGAIDTASLCSSCGCDPYLRQLKLPDGTQLSDVCTSCPACFRIANNPVSGGYPTDEADKNLLCNIGLGGGAACTKDQLNTVKGCYNYFSGSSDLNFFKWLCNNCKGRGANADAVASLACCLIPTTTTTGLKSTRCDPGCTAATGCRDCTCGADESQVCSLPSDTNPLFCHLGTDTEKYFKKCQLCSSPLPAECQECSNQYLTAMAALPNSKFGTILMHKCAVCNNKDNACCTLSRDYIQDTGVDEATTNKIYNDLHCGKCPTPDSWCTDCENLSLACHNDNIAGCGTRSWSDKAKLCNCFLMFPNEPAYSVVRDAAVAACCDLLKAGPPNPYISQAGLICPASATKCDNLPTCRCVGLTPEQQTCNVDCAQTAQICQCALDPAGYTANGFVLNPPDLGSLINGRRPHICEFCCGRISTAAYDAAGCTTQDQATYCVLPGGGIAAP